MRRRRIVHWIEQDVHTRWRRLYTRYQRAGAARKDKNFTNRRERREGKAECREDDE